MNSVFSLFAFSIRKSRQNVLIVGKTLKTTRYYCCRELSPWTCDMSCLSSRDLHQLIDNMSPLMLNNIHYCLFSCSFWYYMQLKLRFWIAVTTVELNYTWKYQAEVANFYNVHLKVTLRVLEFIRNFNFLFDLEFVYIF